MFVCKNAVVLASVLLVIFQSGVKSQPTIESIEVESCSQSDGECRMLIAENDRLKSQLEHEQMLVKNLQGQPVVVKLMKRLAACNFLAFGATTMLDNIYVLCYKPNVIKVFENQNQFRLLTDIALNGTEVPCDIVYNNDENCFYIGDSRGNCIWKMTTTYDHRIDRLTKWMTNATFPRRGAVRRTHLRKNKILAAPLFPRISSLSIDGQLLKLNRKEPFSQLNIGWNADVVRSLQLPEDIKEPRHAVQTLTGNCILTHRLNDARNGTWAISQVNKAGQLIHRFIPRNKTEELDHPVHLSLDSDNSRLFVADYYNHRVVLLNSDSLTWRQALLSNETNEIYFLNRLFYDATQKRLMVAHHSANATQGKVDIYEFN